MQIIKRNGATEPYNREKIAVAIRKSFASTGREVPDETVYTIVDEVELFLCDEVHRSVEQIQDEVERSLMEHGFMPKLKTIYFIVGNVRNGEKLLTILSAV